MSNSNQESRERPSKMYILIWDGMDVGHAVNTAAHAGAMIQKFWPKVCLDLNYEEMTFSSEVDPDMADWYDTSFRKVTCKVSRYEMGLAQLTGLPYFDVTESAYGNEVVALVFKPRRAWPEVFKTFKLYC